MENSYPPIIKKSFDIIKRFEEKFGYFSIRIYHFPQTDGFSTFLESVQRTLLRHRTIGWYMWAKIRGTDRLLLIYFGREQWEGHFEQETNEIIPRLWQRQSDQPYMVADTITVNQQNKDDISDWLARYLISIGAQQTDGPTVPISWHEKSYGTSQINKLIQKKSSRFQAGKSGGAELVILPTSRLKSHTFLKKQKIQINLP